MASGWKEFLRPTGQKALIFAVLVLASFYVFFGFVCGGSMHGPSSCRWLIPLEIFGQIGWWIDSHVRFFMLLGKYPDYLLSNIVYLLNPILWLFLCYLAACHIAQRTSKFKKPPA